MSKRPIKDPVLLRQIYSPSTGRFLKTKASGGSFRGVRREK